MVAFTLRLTEDMDQRLELISFLEGKTKTQLIREALMEYLKQYKNVKDPRE